jgi:hypothetical protein
MHSMNSITFLYHTRFFQNFFEMPFTQFAVWQARLIGDAFDFYSGGTWCETRLGHRQNWLRLHVYLLSLSIPLPGQCLNRPRPLPVPWPRQSSFYTWKWRTISIPGQYTWDLWWAMLNWHRILSEYYSFNCQYPTTIAPYSFTHISLTSHGLISWQSRHITHFTR